MTPPPSNSSEYSAADELMALVARSFDDQGIGHVVIGGQAVVQHGYSRTTIDVDFTVAIGLDRIDQIVRHLGGLGIVPRFHQDREAIRGSQVFFGFHQGLKMRVDFSFVDAPYLMLAISRAQVHPIEGYPVRFLCLEDLLIHKVLASRPQDMADITQLLLVNPCVNHEEVERWLREYEPLVEKALVDQYRQLRREAEA